MDVTAVHVPPDWMSCASRDREESTVDHHVCQTVAYLGGVWVNDSSSAGRTRKVCPQAMQLYQCTDGGRLKNSKLAFQQDYSTFLE